MMCLSFLRVGSCSWGNDFKIVTLHFIVSWSECKSASMVVTKVLLSSFDPLRLKLAYLLVQV